MTTFANLFTPLTVRGRTIPNRIVSTPHATGWELPGGLISDKEVDYHVRKAAGGVGLVMTFGSATVIPPPRHPIGINQGCIGRLYSGYPIVCSVNPAIRDPQLDVLEPTERPRRVVVVGGGVAGMEAAGHAARRGHQVTLIERGSQLGGRSLLNATHGWRPSWHRYLDYLSAELQSWRVKVICGVEATVAEVLNHDPETVVVATGSQLRDRLSAVDGLTLVDADEVIARPPKPRDNSEAVIIDDDCHMVAPTAVDALAKCGWQVTVATSLPMLAGEVDGTLIRFVHERLADVELRVVTDVRFLADPGPDVTLENVHTGKIITLPAPGLVVVAGHRQAVNQLADELRRLDPQLDVRLAGDAHAPRNFDAATAEGALVGSGIL